MVKVSGGKSMKKILNFAYSAFRWDSRHAEETPVRISCAAEERHSFANDPFHWGHF